jgi:hypothetical protein
LIVSNAYWLLGRNADTFDEVKLKSGLEKKRRFKNDSEKNDGNNGMGDSGHCNNYLRSSHGGAV